MSAEAFGRAVLGPVFGEFAVRLHLLLLGLEAPAQTKLLFCARGGLRLRLIYDAYLQAAGLDPPVGYGDLMISRLIAARTALEQGADEAYEELDREFRGDRLGRVVRALTQRQDVPVEDPEAPFTPLALGALFLGSSAAARAVREEVAAQNRLFDQHLAACAGPARRILLCDSGLYGSTVRLLRLGRPDYDWTCALFARSNYKGFSESHFPVTVGLCVEANGFDPTERRTAVLRYWQLIESCLEPDLPSVVSFARVDGEAKANLAAPGWERKLEGQPGELFAGVMAYLRALPPGRAGEQIYADAPAAWKRLYDAIVWPGPRERELLAIPRRSRDFGRTETVAAVVAPKGVRAGVDDIKRSLWREGAVAEHFPLSRPLWLGGLHAAHLGRGALAYARRRRGVRSAAG
ncbi:MAG TPA: hypothetical protein VJS38_03630 [Phenylobacterium sp.]|uniref:hypothetical protein n=1 Tax=Phenylobacterium sp. TaxID=1871053 RepID=UPI002B45BE27|nr:hypothetical protein [Phenylobacterium sp.]HKR87242.1 hypothetical protein [Phenylobacterium sp.]